MVEVTRILARFAAEHRPSDLPQQVSAEGVRAFVNWLGCVFGGCRDEAVDFASAALMPFAGGEQATVVGRGLRTDVITAATLNGLSNCIHSFNDTHMPTVAHPTGPVAAALLALCERRSVSGAALVHALALGIEIECRLANMLAAPPAHCHDGLSTLGVTAPFGASVASGVVLGLTEQQMVWALGLSASFASGVRSTHASMASLLLPGHGARTGLTAAFMAERGFTATERSLESPTGFAAVFGNPANLSEAVDDLGARWETLKNAYKPYPCGIVIHPAIDACLSIANSEGFDPLVIERVELRVHPLAVKLADKPEPRTRMDAIVSLQHWAAAALLHRKAGLQEASAACVSGRDETTVRRLIHLEADARILAEAAEARVTLRNGRTFAARVDACRGSAARPMTDAELSEKFLEQAEPVVGKSRARDVLQRAWDIADMRNAGDLAAHLV